MRGKKVAAPSGFNARGGAKHCAMARIVGASGP